MMKITGLKELQKQMDTLSKNVKALDGSHEIPLPELLTPEFLQKHTRVSSHTELIEKSGFKVESAEDFKAIPDEEWDAYIRSISSFKSWHEMLSEAGKAWAMKKLNLR